jgi:hypothetical protein
VDAVVGKQQRNAQPGGRSQLDGAAHPVRGDVEQRAHVLPSHKVIEVALGIELHALADLLGECHAGQQIRDAISGREAVVLVRMHHVPFDEIER